MTLVKHFKTQRDAKEFLVGEIVREAEREGRPLADLERKMLYFSEGDRPLPDDSYDVAEQFDRTYDRAQYEKKIAKLARAARRQATTDQAAWSEAVRRLEEGDHYLLVMVGEAPRGAAMTRRDRGDRDARRRRGVVGVLHQRGDGVLRMGIRGGRRGHRQRGSLLRGRLEV